MGGEQSTYRRNIPAQPALREPCGSMSKGRKWLLIHDLPLAVLPDNPCERIRGRMFQIVTHLISKRLSVCQWTTSHCTPPG